MQGGGRKRTCNVKRRSSIWTSLVRKSAPMVALYWLLNLLLTYWFISEVLPTPLSPRMMTLRSIRLRDAMGAGGSGRAGVGIGERSGGGRAAACWRGLWPVGEGIGNSARCFGRSAWGLLRRRCSWEMGMGDPRSVGYRCFVCLLGPFRHRLAPRSSS